MVNIITDFLEVKNKSAGSGSEVYWTLFWGPGLPSMGMGGIFNAGLPP